MPTVLDDHDIIWILWGAILLYCPSNIVVATSYELYCSHWKKQCKHDRLGLLWAVYYHVSCSYKAHSNYWNAEEQKMYNHVAANITSLWKQVVGDNDEHVASTVQFEWTQYFPRGNVCQTTDLPHFKEESRFLKIKDKQKTTKDETSDTDPRNRRLYPCE
jgi:hypothetical protein